MSALNQTDEQKFIMIEKKILCLLEELQQVREKQRLSYLQIQIDLTLHELSLCVESSKRHTHRLSEQDRRIRKEAIPFIPSRLLSNDQREKH